MIYINFDRFTKQIKEITDNKKQYLELLLVGDEQESMIDKYLQNGTMFVLFDDNPRAVCVVMQKYPTVLEIKNLAVAPAYQKRGYGSYMLNHIFKTYKNTMNTILVGTGENENTISFYIKNGFVYSHKIENFFVENYDRPIFENGRQLKDMIYFKLSFKQF